MSAPIVLVGGGLATGTAVRELRSQGYVGDLVVIAGEAHPPYERPPLSKGYLLGNEPAEKALVNQESWYAEHDVDLRTGVTVESVDPDARTLRAGGEDLEWTGLLLATGATPRHLALADDSGAPVHYLRTLEDSTELKARLEPGRPHRHHRRRLDRPRGRQRGAAGRCRGRRPRGARPAVAQRARPGGRRAVRPAPPREGRRRPHRRAGRLDHLRLGRRHDRAGRRRHAHRRPPGRRRRSRAHRPTSRPPPVSRSTTASWSTRACAPRRPGSSPPATSRTSTTPSSATGCGSSTGTPRSSTAPSPRPTCSAAARSPTICPTSSPTSTPSGSSTSATPARTASTGSSSPATPTAPSSRARSASWWLRGSRVVAGMHVNDWDAIDRVRELVGTDVDEAELQQ